MDEPPPLLRELLTPKWLAIVPGQMDQIDGESYSLRMGRTGRVDTRTDSFRGREIYSMS